MVEKPDTAFTVGDLRTLIKDLEDDVPCGVTDHYGEFVGFDYKPTISKGLQFSSYKGLTHKRLSLDVSLIFQAVDIGPEPD